MQIPLAVEGRVAVHIQSYGLLHGAPGEHDLMVDLRDYIRDPHIDPRMRESTGRDLAVRVHVLATPGALLLVEHLAGMVLALLGGDTAPARPVRLGLACQGGRHRSVVVAEAVAERIRLLGVGVLLEHVHINCPVKHRT